MLVVFDIGGTRVRAAASRDSNGPTYQPSEPSGQAQYAYQACGAISDSET